VPGRAGFTLVEILVATVVLAVALIAIATIFPAGRLSGKKAECLAIAAGIAQSEIDGLRTTQFQSVQPSTASTSHPRLPDGNTVTVEITGFATAGDDDDPDLMKVRVNVRWPGGAMPWVGGQLESETFVWGHISD
jgi:prepilin-type N-terminal cleavage/methylation domain-containing protein